MPSRPGATLIETALWLADTPVRPIDGFPDDVTRGLFGVCKPHLRLTRGVGIPTQTQQSRLPDGKRWIGHAPSWLAQRKNEADNARENGRK